ncbi:zinc finger MYND domain-containing protein 12-like [Tubulanus polymorphus]|uniref:zinc finger MYND domain-containing protein 12-like n=1 Tax=Tubulanus polymorphus TaxID=672921 RepID=UPI003DA21CE2
MTLNPLANPKGVKLVCELCQKPAFIQCTDCRVTYYCGVEHQRADWLGIHEKICQLLIPLRTATPFIASEEDRQKRRFQILEKQRQMIDLTRTTGQKLLFESKHEEAVPAAMQSLRFAIDVHGIASIELVPSYLILGEASIGLDRLNQAEQYLAQAQWTVLKTPECSNAIRSKLYRNLGLLYAAKGDFSEALRSLADDIWYASNEFGSDDIRTSGGYFHMANVFLRKEDMETADSLYKRVLDIWYDHLLKIVKMRTKTPIAPKGVGLVVAEINQEPDIGLDEAQEAEAKKVLNLIQEVYGQNNEVTKATLIKVTHALAMLYFVLRDGIKAVEFKNVAIRTCQDFPEDDPVAKDISSFDRFLTNASGI